MSNFDAGFFFSPWLQEALLKSVLLCNVSPWPQILHVPSLCPSLTLLLEQCPLIPPGYGIWSLLLVPFLQSLCHLSFHPRGNSFSFQDERMGSMYVNLIKFYSSRDSNSTKDLFLYQINVLFIEWGTNNIPLLRNVWKVPCDEVVKWGLKVWLFFYLSVNNDWFSDGVPLLVCIIVFWIQLIHLLQSVLGDLHCPLRNL